MSLGIIFKGPEGIVLAADSRVTLTAEIPGQKTAFAVSYDNTNKLLKVHGQDHVGAVTYGVGAIGMAMPRTPHSYLPELESELPEDRMSVKGFAEKLNEFYRRQWEAHMPGDYKGPDLVFLIAGFDENEAYGRVFEVNIPSNPTPKEWHEDSFGGVWGGQREFTDRLIQGFDPRLLGIVKEKLRLSESQVADLDSTLREQLSVPIPYPFLPLQDCVDLAILLIRTTMNIQRWHVGIRGVGGAIDVATITRTDGFREVQQKKVRGELLTQEDDERVKSDKQRRA